MTSQLRVVLVRLTAVAVRNHILHLANQASASLRDSSRGRFQGFLSLGHERCLDTACSHKLRRGSSNVVGCNNETLMRSAARDDIISSFDQYVCAACYSFGSGNEAFSPAIMLLVEGCTGGGTLAVLDNFLLGSSSGFDELSNRIRDGDSRVEDRTISC